MYVGEIDADRYAEHLASPDVQAILARARKGLTEKEVARLQHPHGDVIVVTHTYGPSRPHRQ